MNKVKNSKALKIFTRIVLIIVVLIIHCIMTYLTITNTFKYGSPFEAVIVLLSTIISSVVNVFIVAVIVAYAIDRVIVLWKWAWSSDE